MKGLNLLLLALYGSVASGIVLDRRSIGCNHDNCLRQLLASSQATSFCHTYTTAVQTGSTGLPSYVSQCSSSASRISSACSCIATLSTSITTTSSSSSLSTSSSSLSSSSSPSTTSSSSSSSIISSTTSSTMSSSIDTTSDNWFSTSLGSTFLDATQTVTVSATSSTSTVQPTATGLPLLVGPWDGTNNTLDSIKSASSKKFLAGQDNGDGSYFLTIINITAATDSALINLEDFTSFINDVTCGTDSIDITFVDASAASAAIEDWLPGMGLITSGAALCGNDTTRSYYSITGDIGSSANTVTLLVQPAAISQIGSQLKFDFGTLQPGQVSPIAPFVGTDIQPAWDAIVNYYSSFSSNSTTKRGLGIDTSSSTTWDVTPEQFAGYEGRLINQMPLWLDSNIDPEKTSIECNGCGVFGEMTLSGGVTVHLSDLSHPDMYVSLDMNNVDIVQDWWIVTYEAFTLISPEYDLVDYSPVELAVPNLFSIGPVIKLKAGIEVDVGPQFEINDLGFSWTMNGPSSLKVGSDGYDWSGWDMSFEPLSPSIDVIDSSISFQGYVAPSLELDFQVLADLHIPFVPKIELDWEIYFQMKIPEIIVQFSPAGPGATCYNPQDQFDYAIEVLLGADLSTGITGDFIPDNWNFDIWDPTWPITPEWCESLNFD